MAKSLLEEETANSMTLQRMLLELKHEKDEIGCLGLAMGHIL